MLDNELYIEGVPGLDEAILAEDYALISRERIERSMFAQKKRKKPKYGKSYKRPGNLSF